MNRKELARKLADEMLDGAKGDNDRERLADVIYNGSNMLEVLNTYDIVPLCDMDRDGLTGFFQRVNDGLVDEVEWGDGIGELDDEEDDGDDGEEVDDADSGDEVDED